MPQTVSFGGRSSEGMEGGAEDVKLDRQVRRAGLLGVGMSFRVLRGRIWQGLPILRSPFSPQGSSTRGDALKASSPRDPGHILGQRPSPTESDARPGWGR